MCGRYLHFRLPYILLEAASFQRLSLKVHEEKAISVQCGVLQPNQEAFALRHVVNIRTSLRRGEWIETSIGQGITRLRRDEFISKGKGP